MTNKLTNFIELVLDAKMNKRKIHNYNGAVTNLAIDIVDAISDKDKPITQTGMAEMLNMNAPKFSAILMILLEMNTTACSMARLHPLQI